MDAVIHFMNSLPGRALRVGLGLALVAVGVFALQGTGGLVVALVGLLPLGLGLWGPCALELLRPPATRLAR